MTQGVIGVDRKATVSEALKLMHERRVKALVVEDSGIITRRDILSKVIASDKNLDQTLVQEIMSSPLVTVHPEATVQETAKIISRRGLSRFPVAYEDQIIGFVSASDILKAIALDMKQ